MLTRHDWSSPFANGSPVSSSAKLLDRAIAASYKVFGVYDWSARLPIALCVLATMVALFFLARSLFGWNAAGFYSALIFLVWPGVFLATRDLTATPIRCLAIILFLYGLWHWLVVKKLPLPGAVAITVLACAAVLLTGKWPGILLPLAMIVMCWVLRLTVPPAEHARRLLFGWAVFAYFGDGIWNKQLHSPAFWLIVFPPLALILGGWLANQEAFAERATGRRFAWYVFLLGLFVVAITVFFAFHRPVGFWVFKRSIVVTLPGDRAPLLIVAAAILVGTAGSLLYRLRNNARTANCFLAGTLGGIIVAIQVGFVLASPYRSSQILADAIRPELAPSDIVVIDGKYPEASSFSFYLEHPVQLALPSTKPIVVNTASPPFLAAGPPTVDIDRIWNGDARVFLWTRTRQPLPVPGSRYVVARSGGKEVLSNQPNSAGASF
jgi:hypothetical protein